MRTPLRVSNTNHFPLVIRNTGRESPPMTLNPRPHLEIIPPTWTEWFKEYANENKGKIASLQEGQSELVKLLENLKGVCEDLLKYAAKFKDVLSDLKVEEGLLKVLNGEFGANLERLETAFNSGQVELQRESNETEVTTAVEEPYSVPPPNT